MKGEYGRGEMKCAAVMLFGAMLGLVSASNDANPLSTSDVIGLVSQFLDLSDLFGFRQVCRLFDEWAHITVAERVGVHRPIDNSHRVHLVSLNDNAQVLEYLPFYQGWNDQRTLIQFEDKPLLVRGVGTHVSPGYTGRCLVKRRMDIGTGLGSEAMMDFSSKTDPEWMYNYHSKYAVSLHSGLKIHSTHQIIAIRIPFFVALNEGTLELYSINNCQFQDSNLLSQVSTQVFWCFNLRLFPNPNSKKGWPMMIALHSCEYSIIDFEMRTMTTHLIPGVYPSNHVQMDWLHSPEPLVMCVISNQHCWRVINLKTGKTISESVIPLRSYIENGPRKMYSDSEDEEEEEEERDRHEIDLIHPYYNCICNGRYGLIAFSSRVRKAVEVDDCFLLYDLQTGELIGSGISSYLEWISEELFRVSPSWAPYCIVRSVHQPRQDIKCVMVDEHGNEEPLRHSFFIGQSQVLNQYPMVLFQQGSVISVEWEKSVLPSEKRQRTH